MSDADATDPVKALREWCAINSFLCQHVLEDLRAGKRRGEAGERWMIRDVYAAALRSLEAAPALLARIEAGEGLLAAMQARAEKAERERDIARGVAEDRTEAALRAKEEYAAALEKVAERVKALESTLAEAAPVVEAAERLEPHIRTLSAYMDGSTACTVEQKGVKILGELRSAVRAARSLRGAGGGA